VASTTGDPSADPPEDDRPAGVNDLQDHYSVIAAKYAAFRPTYPHALFEWLSTLAPSRALVWDCGTGSGQAAAGLAGYFGRVHATDPSQAQLDGAHPHPRISYQVGQEADSGLPEQSASLVTAAQAAHWFDLIAFYAEVDRILLPGGVLAIWSYSATIIDEAIDPRLDWFRRERVGNDWPPGREHVDDGYSTLPFPYPEFAAPSFSIQMDWDLHQLLGYVSSWSAVARCMEREGTDPLGDLATVISRRWGEPATTRRITWPLSIRVGLKPGTTRGGGP
jgi:SAM-dependent methyltransferase